MLGPTEHRIARFLDHATRHGRITMRTVDLAAATGLERSEAYRITRRLRTLGLFGIENDRGGTRGGRRYWRTPLEHDEQMLDGARHRAAWSRIVGWARTRRDRLHKALAGLRAHNQAGLIGTRASRPDSGPAVPYLRPVGVSTSTPGALPGPLPSPRGGPGSTFAQAMRRHGLGPLMDEWARAPRRSWT